MTYHSNHHHIMADKERIMSLEGQNAELCDRIAELEREKMLREIAEEELLQRKAYELAMKMAKDMLEKERAAIREEESARAKDEAESLLKEKLDAVDRRSKALDYDEKRICEEAEKLAHDKLAFEQSKVSLCESFATRMKETDERRRAEFALRLAQAKDESYKEIHAYLGEALARGIDKLTQACDVVGTNPAAYDKAISEFKEEASVIESAAVSDLTSALQKIGATVVRKDRFLNKLVRTLFGSISEKNHPEDQVSALLDAFIADPDRVRLSSAEEADLKESRRKVEEYTRRKAALKLLENSCREEEEQKMRKHAHHTQLTVGLPVLEDVEVIYPAEYYLSPDSFKEIVPDGGREHHDEIVPSPSRYAVRRTEYPTVVRKGDMDAKPLQASRKVRPIDNSCSSPELLSKIEVGKYVWKEPWNRQEQKFSMEGVPVRRSTLDSWHTSVCNLLEPLYEEHERDFFNRSHILCADGSPMRIVNREKHRTDNYYMINFLSQDLGLSLFEVSLRKADDDPEKLAGNGRGSEDISLILTQWKHPEVIMTDGYAGYNASVKKLGADHCCCNAHARRKFEECESENRTISLMGQSFYANISIVEKLIAEEGLTGKKKTARRKELEQPIWKAFIAWALTEHAKATDGSAVKGALGYFLERQKELQMYMNYPEMPFTNNDCERQIREMVMGRKNYLFCQNHLAARRAAMMYSFFGTCKLLGKNPEEWLTYVLEHIRTTPADQLYRLLPQYCEPNMVF